MNLYRVTQNVNSGYDTYDAMIVAAESEETAKKMHPSEYVQGADWITSDNPFDGRYTWALPDEVHAEFIGTTHLQAGVVLASFNAG